MRILLYLTVCAVNIIPSYLQKVNLNLKYGNDPAQLIDIYEPASNASKAILVIHGGAWFIGRKEDTNYFVDQLRKQYPNYLIANMDYRLGNVFSPAYPKQLEDIDAAIQFLRLRNGKDLRFVLNGISSGAHMAMLYGYKINRDNIVKVIVDMIGPADLTTKTFTDNILLNLLGMNLVGPYFYSQNPEVYNITSPVTWITPSAPPTIGFYGNKDPLIPNDQLPILQKKLQQNNVTNEFSIYPGGHGDWAPKYQQDMFNKIEHFLKLYF